MRRTILICLWACTNLAVSVMDIKVDIPFYVISALWSSFFTATVILYWPEIRTVGSWVIRYRKMRIDEIARRALKMGEEKQRTRQAELILAQYIEDPEEKIRTLKKLAEKHRAEDMSE